MLDDLRERELWKWLGLCAWILIVAGAPLVAGALIGNVGTNHCMVQGKVFEPGNNPEVVFLGNSMVYTRINPTYLSDITGTPIGMLAGGGTEMPTWYLQAKNVIAPAVKPGTNIVIFFRGDDLTHTEVSTSVQAKCFEDTFRASEEDEFDAIAHRNLTRFERFRDLLVDHYSIQQWSPDVTKLVLRVAASPMLPDLLSSTFKRRLGDGTDVNAKEIIDLFADLELATEDLFSSGKLRSSPAPNLPKYPEFSAVFAESFLPLMMDVIQEYELSIIFVHVQSQANANGIVSRSENASQYLGALQQYLASKGARYYDLTGDPAITLSMYGVGDHIAPDSMERYMEIFVERLPRLFERATPLPAEPSP